MAAALDRYRGEMASSHVDCNTDLSFHTALPEASKNPIAVMVWQMLSTRLAEILSVTITLPHICEETLADHEKILRAIKSRAASGRERPWRAPG